MSFAASVAGRFAREALSNGPGEVCAVFRRSFYLRCPGERYACVGDASLGRGPLNALVADFRAPALGQRISVSLENCSSWEPSPASEPGLPKLKLLKEAAASRVPNEGLGCLILGKHNALSVHAQPALEALERWLVGNSLERDVERLIGLGPGLTPSGDDYLGGVLVSLRLLGRQAQAEALWRWLAPRLIERTSAISAAHLAAAASGQAHEALDACLNAISSIDRVSWDEHLEQLDAVGHCSGWDGLAGAVAVAKNSG
jgi:hypothetical protein